MEAALSNLIEPGDRLLACIHGYFGERLAEMADRYGAQTKRLQRPWGEVFDLDEIDLALSTFPAKIVTLVHAETSTGALQPDIDVISEICHRRSALLVLDCVTSLGGMPVEIYNIEIAGGFGPLAGKIWHIGLMGYSSRVENVRLLLATLEDLLGE